MVALAPLALLFFVTYDSAKAYTKDKLLPVALHMLLALMGEIAACLVRVPAEVIKQRTQAGFGGATGNNTSWLNFLYLVQNKLGEGVLRGLYRGWNTTIMREIPFTMIQFPLYEFLKREWHARLQQQGGGLDQPLLLARGAICGLAAGAVAAAATTPLDVIKTRIMLAPTAILVPALVRQLVAEEGWSALWKGVGPRTMWISAGGAIFLGCYELVSLTLKLSLPLYIDKP